MNRGQAMKRKAIESEVSFSSESQGLMSAPLTFTSSVPLRELSIQLDGQSLLEENPNKQQGEFLLILPLSDLPQDLLVNAVLNPDEEAGTEQALRLRIGKTDITLWGAKQIIDVVTLPPNKIKETP
ncbi:MAG: hypothetical protein ACK5NG_11065 [Chthoniobacterales bacterium]